MIILKLDSDINYIVSGLERSGTSMLMQILQAGDISISYDDLRKKNNFNQKGYFELEGGKIINKLISGNFDFNKYKGSFIKITAFGLKYLPLGKYKIIYSERNMDEILTSMEKMASLKDDERNITKKSFLKLNNKAKETLVMRPDIDVLFLNYNKIISNPKLEIEKIPKFLSISNIDINKMIQAIDKNMYHERK